MDAELRRRLADAQDRHWWYAGRRAILRKVIARMNLPTSATLLEAGCGSGANLGVLAEFGELYAFEPDHADRERALKRGIGTVEPGALPDGIPFGSRRFDLILAADVIEHLDDDSAALGALLHRLAPRGKLVVTVPAHAWLWSRHDTWNEHRRRYDRKSLAGAVHSARGRITHLTWFNTLLAPAVVAGRFIDRRTKGLPGGVQPPPEPINRLLAGLFSSESALAAGPGLPFGISLLAVVEPGTPPDLPR